MIRSVTLIRFRAGTDEASREAVRQAYLGLPAHIPELLSISPGLDLGNGLGALLAVGGFARERSLASGRAARGGRILVARLEVRPGIPVGAGYDIQLAVLVQVERIERSLEQVNLGLE